MLYYQCYAQGSLRRACLQAMFKGMGLAVDQNWKYIEVYTSWCVDAVIARSPNLCKDLPLQHVPSLEFLVWVLVVVVVVSLQIAIGE